MRLLTGLAPAPDEDAARAAERAKAHQELEAENAKKLQNYAWVDKAKGTVQIPIERAMELAIVELNSKKPTAAGPIATPAPSPAAHRRLRPRQPPRRASRLRRLRQQRPQQPHRSARRQPHRSTLRRQPRQPRHLPLRRRPRHPHRRRGTYAASPAASPAPPAAPAAPTPTDLRLRLRPPRQDFSNASHGQSMTTQRCSAGDATLSGR